MVVSLKKFLLPYTLVLIALSYTINVMGMIPLQVPWVSEPPWNETDIKTAVNLLSPTSAAFYKNAASEIPSIKNVANAQQLLMHMIPALNNTNSEYSYNLIDTLTQRIDQLDPQTQHIRFTQDHIPDAIILISGYNRINGAENKKLITWLTWFIKRGLPVDAPSRDDATILMYHATNQKRIDVVKLLLQNGAKPDTITKTFQNDQVPVLTSAQRARDHAFTRAKPEEYEKSKAITELLEKPERANKQPLFLQWLQNRKTLAASIVGAIALYSGYRWLTSSPKAEINNNVLINNTGTPLEVTYVTDHEKITLNPLLNGTFALPINNTLVIKLVDNAIKPLEINLDEWAEKRETHYLNIIVTKRWMPGWLSRWIAPLTYSIRWVEKTPTAQ